MSRIVKRHKCGAEYTDVDWQQLRLDGHMLALKGQAFEALELRDCARCHSCLTRRLVRVPASALPDGSSLTVLEYAPVDEPAVEPAGGEAQDGQAQAAA